MFYRSIIYGGLGLAALILVYNHFQKKIASITHTHNEPNCSIISLNGTLTVNGQYFQELLQQECQQKILSIVFNQRQSDALVKSFSW